MAEKTKEGGKSSSVKEKEAGSSQWEGCHGYNVHYLLSCEGVCLSTSDSAELSSLEWADIVMETSLRNTTFTRRHETDLRGRGHLFVHFCLVYNTL